MTLSTPSALHMSHVTCVSSVYSNDHQRMHVSQLLLAVSKHCILVLYTLTIWSTGPRGQIKPLKASSSISQQQKAVASYIIYIQAQHHAAGFCMLLTLSLRPGRRQVNAKPMHISGGICIPWCIWCTSCVKLSVLVQDTSGAGNSAKDTSPCAQEFTVR